MWEGVGDRTELQHINPLLAITAFLSRSPGLLNRGSGAQPLWDMFLNPASHLQLVWSPTDWISCALSYIIVQRPPSSCGRHNFALIQPVHGQGYNILIFLDRMHLLFTQVYFLFWLPGRVGGQYKTFLLNPKILVLSNSLKIQWVFI